MSAEMPAAGSLWERDDEVFRVVKVYEAQVASSPAAGTFPAYMPITLVKHVCVEPMPNHSPLDRFLELYEPYDPEAER